MSRKDTSRTNIVAALCLVTLVTALVLALRSRWFIHDDALISLRYAQNLAQHGVLHWNLGEPVEGYTNLLFVLLSSALIKIGVDPIFAARSINIAALAAMLFLFATLVRHLTSGLAATVGMCLIGASMPLILWCFGGLEAPFLALWILLLCILTHHMILQGPNLILTVIAAAVAGLAYLTRPDAAIIAGVAALFLWLGTGLNRRGFWAATLFSAVFLMIVAAHVGWRIMTYSEFLPMTLYAKAVGIPSLSTLFGLNYIRNFTLQTPFVPLLAVLALAAGRATKAHRPLMFMATVLIVYSVYLVRIGGDHMLQYRLLAPLIPIVALMLAATLAVRPRLLIPAALILIVTLPAQLLPLSGQAKEPIDPAATVGKIIGDHIASSWPPNTTTALNTAGSVPFLNPDKRFIDMLGLNDPVIARREVDTISLVGQALPGHAKGDGDYVLSRAPNYIILGPAEGRDVGEPWFLSDLEIAEDPRFADCYIKHRTEIPYDTQLLHDNVTRPNPLIFTYYQRRDSVECSAD